MIKTGICLECGAAFIKSSANQKTCPPPKPCSEKRRKRKNNNRVKRHYAANHNVTLTLQKMQVQWLRRQLCDISDHAVSEKKRMFCCKVLAAMERSAS